MLPASKAQGAISEDRHVEDHATQDGSGNPAVGFDLDDRGAALFGALTKANIDNSLAMLVDDKVMSAPVIRTALGRQGIIIGRFTEHEVKDLVHALGGAAATQPAAATAPVNVPAAPSTAPVVNPRRLEPVAPD